MSKAPPFHTTERHSRSLSMFDWADFYAGFVSAPGIKAGTVSLLGRWINQRAMKSINKQSEYEQNKYLAFPTTAFSKR